MVLVPGLSRTSRSKSEARLQDEYQQNMSTLVRLSYDRPLEPSELRYGVFDIVLTRGLDSMISPGLAQAAIAHNYAQHDYG